MLIRIKVDEDLSRELVQHLRDVGHDARSVHEQGLVGSGDYKLWNVAQGEQRWLLTADKGFADARVFSPSGDSGIILFRLPRESRKGYLRLAQSMLAHLDFAEARGSIVVVTPENIRIHRGM